jgi:hypothetical protein
MAGRARNSGATNTTVVWHCAGARALAIGFCISIILCTRRKYVHPQPTLRCSPDLAALLALAARGGSPPATLADIPAHPARTS